MSLYDLKLWKRLRQQRLLREPLCRFCAQAGRITPAAVVDHIRPHRGDLGVFSDPDNLQSLCKSCHDRHKQRMEKSGTGLPGCGPDGLPLDVEHHWHK